MRSSILVSLNLYSTMKNLFAFRKLVRASHNIRTCLVSPQMVPFALAPLRASAAFVVWLPQRCFPTHRQGWSTSDRALSLLASSSTSSTASWRRLSSSLFPLFSASAAGSLSRTGLREVADGPLLSAFFDEAVPSAVRAGGFLPVAFVLPARLCRCRRLLFRVCTTLRRLLVCMPFDCRRGVAVHHTSLQARLEAHKAP